MRPPLTLHDFVIHLLSDADARTAFDLDPDGALRDAGLHDVTPADVRDVIPLVADYAPAHVAGLSGGLPAFGTSALGTDRDGVAHQVQFVTAQLPGSTGDLTLAAAGGLRGVTSGVVGGISAVGAQPVSGDAGLSGHVRAGDPGGAHLSGAAGASGHAGLSGAAGHAGLSGAGGLTGDLAPGHDPVGHLTGTLGPLDPGHLLDTTGLDAGGLDPTGLDPTGLDHTGLTGTLPGAVPATVSSLPDLHGATAPLHGVTAPLHGSGPLGLGAGADPAAQGHADGHLLDLPHLF
ncbi:MAG: hypothetical protein AUI10_05600 [Actinobacteria bacterium 13_2_20CM_2_72_6]|nr:MAG: hypothetical protein AUI10_05600 [Actinobacteria bacterium 13_2_20CM_2_72_6]